MIYFYQTIFVFLIYRPIKEKHNNLVPTSGFDINSQLYLYLQIAIL